MTPCYQFAMLLCVCFSRGCTALNLNFLGYVKFKTTHGYAHTSYHTAVAVRSALQCAGQCRQTRNCCSFSFGPSPTASAGECRLSRTCLFSPDSARQMQGWSIHTRTDVLCNLISEDPLVTKHYQQLWVGAAPLCATYGGTLASVAQLWHMWRNGFQVCAWGWVADATRRFPMQHKTRGCGNAIGLITAGYSSTALANVWCHFTHESNIRSDLCWPLQ